MDVHEAGNQGQNDASRRFASHAEENRYYWGKIRSLPYRCLVNAQVGNLLTVGRCTSVSYRAQGAFRTAPIVGAIGHAGGLAAALSAKAGIAPRDLDPNLLRENPPRGRRLPPRLTQKAFAASQMEQGKGLSPLPCSILSGVNASRNHAFEAC